MRLRKRHLVSLAAVTAALGTIVVVVSYSAFVPHQVSRRFTDNLLRERGYRLDLDAVRASAHGEILLVHPRISTLADSSRVVMRAEAVRVRVRELRGWFSGRVTLGLLRIERPRFDWQPEMARKTAGVSGTTGPRFPRLGMDAIEIVDARVARASPRDVVADHVDLRAHLDSRPDRLQIELQQARAVLPGDSLGIEDLHAALTIQGDSIRVDDFRLRTAGSRLQGALRVVPRTPLARGQL